jgi:cell division septal protein FtsQ
MAKEEEKEGKAIAKKDTRKRRSESNRKPDGSSTREDAKPKKKKMEYVVSLATAAKSVIGWLCYFFLLFALLYAFIFYVCSL